MLPNLPEIRRSINMTNDRLKMRFKNEPYCPLIIEIDGQFWVEWRNVDGIEIYESIPYGDNYGMAIKYVLQADDMYRKIREWDREKMDVEYSIKFLLTVEVKKDLFDFLLGTAREGTWSPELNGVLLTWKEVDYLRVSGNMAAKELAAVLYSVPDKVRNISSSTLLVKEETHR